LWKWSAEKKTVTYRLVPRSLYNEELAEQACYDGLEIDKDDLSLRAMAIAVYFAQKLELLGVESPEVDRALSMAILVGGKEALVRCLDKALIDGDLGISVLTAQALGEVGAGKGFTLLEQVKSANPLLAALEQKDRAVRFAAAGAIIACQPSAPRATVSLPGGADAAMLRSGGFDNYQKVLPAISWGLMYESPSRTVLIVHPSTDVINYYKGELRKLGHEVVDATEAVTGVNLAAALPQPDLVLLGAEHQSALGDFRTSLGSDRIPIVLLASSGKQETLEESLAGAIAGVLVDRASVESIRLVLARAFETPEKRLVKDLLGHISARAADSLASVVPAASALPMRQACPALRRTLASADDAVRLGALRALGNVPVEESALPVLAVAADRNAQKPVRLAALEALAKILEAHSQVPPDVFTDLVPISSDPDPGIALGAARAISVAKLDPGQFTDLMVLKRVQEIRAGVAP
jgi:HEAT repeat protein